MYTSPGHTCKSFSTRIHTRDCLYISQDRLGDTKERGKKKKEEWRGENRSEAKHLKETLHCNSVIANNNIGSVILKLIYVVKLTNSVIMAILLGNRIFSIRDKL